MSVLTVKPTFLYPTSRQFPFDEVAEQIVKALAKRNWNVPGITVEFYSYGAGEAKYKMASNIIGEDFKLHFGRPQASLPGDAWADIAALSEICIPQQIMEVYEDESGPSYYLYVGKNWEEEKSWFFNSIKVHSRLENKPRRYLRYKGTTYKTRTRYLVYDDDLGREYSPEGDEPQSFVLSEKFAELTAWLEDHVLKYILTFPEQTPVEDEEPALTPYNGPWPILYSYCDSKDVARILKGKADPSQLPDFERHAFFGSGRRLVPLGVRNNGRFPETANNGFIWCDTKSVTCYDVMVNMRSFFGSHSKMALVKLKYANDVYVADNSVYEETRQQLFDAIAPRKQLTNEEVDTAIAARGATIVPITEYKGDYKEPIVLIARELDFCEVDSFINVEK